MKKGPFRKTVTKQSAKKRKMQHVKNNSKQFQEKKRYLVEAGFVLDPKIEMSKPANWLRSAVSAKCKMFHVFSIA